MFEREFASHISAEKIIQAISSLSLTPSVRYTNVSKTIATCKLKDKENTTVAAGAGKGRHCKTGALAESVEHFVLEQHYAEGLVPCSTKDICSQPIMSMDGILTNLPKSTQTIDCVEMSDMQSGRTALLPAVLQRPHGHLTERIKAFPEASFLKKYSSNSGIAFGCTKQEAILHGLNEIIERHMLSKILMSLCNQNERLFVQIPSVSMLEKIFDGQTETFAMAKRMKIFFTKSIYGVYFCMAIPKRPIGRLPMCPVGSGCSIDIQVAIERACTELTQAIDLYDETEEATDLSAYALIRRSPTLQPLIHLEALRNIGYICNRADPPARASVTDQVGYIIDRVSATGMRVLYRDMYLFENGCVVTQIYIPGLERFNLIRAGLPVVPQQLLHSNRAGL